MKLTFTVLALPNKPGFELTLIVDILATPVSYRIHGGYIFFTSSFSQSLLHAQWVLLPFWSQWALDWKQAWQTSGTNSSVTVEEMWDKVHFICSAQDRSIVAPTQLSCNPDQQTDRKCYDRKMFMWLIKETNVCYHPRLSRKKWSNSCLQNMCSTTWFYLYNFLRHLKFHNEITSKNKYFSFPLHDRSFKYK